MRPSLVDALVVLVQREDLALVPAARVAATCRELHRALRPVCQDNMTRRREAMADHEWWCSTVQKLHIYVSSFLERDSKAAELGTAAARPRPIPSPDRPNDPFWIANLIIEVHADVQDAAALRKACEYVSRVCTAPVSLVLWNTRQLTDDMLLLCARRALKVILACCYQITDASVQHLTCCKVLVTRPYSPAGITRASLENLPSLFRVDYECSKRSDLATYRWLRAMKSHRLMRGMSQAH
jgi:hypothetical protein